MALTWIDNSITSNATATNGNNIVTLATEGDPITNSNILYLLDGNDFAAMDFGNDEAYGGQGNDTIYGGVGNDKLYGGIGSDVLYGDGGNDVLVADAGADALFGGAGNDTLRAEVADGEWDNLAGGNGDDTYEIWDSKDVISNEAGFATSTSRDIIVLNVASYNMNATTDTQAIENLEIGFLSGQNGATVNGNMFANTITGFDGRDTITGDAGNDLITGGKDADSLTGSIGDDTLKGEDGSDRIDGSSGQDKIYGGNATDYLLGGAQSDTIWGDDGDDAIYGGAGNDTMYAGSGNSDVMQGDAGDDRYFLTSDSQRVYENGSGGYDIITTSAAIATFLNKLNVEAMFYQGAAVEVTFTGSANADTLSIFGASSGRINGMDGDDDLTGSNGNDLIFGGKGSDFMQGLGGNDTLNGDLGIDDMRGGAGNDTYVAVSADDKVFESVNAGYDTVQLRSGVLESYTLTENVEAGHILVGGYTRTLVGNTLDNVLGTDVTSGSTLRGMDGLDKLVGGTGGDSLSGGNGADTLTGGGGADTLNGGTGADLMQGGAGDDTYWVDNMADKVVESIFGNGIDTVKAQTGGWTLGADIENLIYLGSGPFTGTGSDIANRIEGGTGSDNLHGMGGNDVLIGKGGSDAMWGGTGADQFVFNNNNGVLNNSHVLDFDGGVDTLVLDNDANWNMSFVDMDTTRFTSATGGIVIVDGLDIGHVWNSVDFV